MSTSNPIEVNRLRVQVLYRQTLFVQIAGFLNAVLYAYLMLDYVEKTMLVSWIVVSGTIYVSRYSLHTWFNLVKSKQPFDPAFWENVFTSGVFTSGLVWSFAGLYFMPLRDLAQCAFLGFLLAGITAAAAAAYITSLRAILAFLLPAVLPFAYRLFQGGTPFHYSMSFLTLLYAVVIASAMASIHKIALESIVLRFEKDHALKELRETQALIINSAKMAALGEMAGGVAHEINTPLGVLQFSADALVKEAQKDQIDSKKLLEMAKKLEAMISRISKIVKNLMSFAGQDEQDAPVALSVKQLLIETLDFCQSRFQNHGIVLELDPVPENLIIRGKSAQISHAILNLLNNSFDAVANKPHPRVVISVAENDDEVFFSITDNGDGIPIEICEKIMQPFFTTKDIGKGAGLGLSVSLGIARSHHGNLALEPSESGACFKLSIPKAAARAVT